MSLASDVAAALPLLRAEAEALMVDSCTITRDGGAPTFDPNTGTYTDPAGSTVYTGACQVQLSDGLSARSSEAGGTELITSRVTVKIPVSATGVRVGDVVTITAATLDPDLVDHRYVIAAEHAKTFATARRLEVERYTS